MNKSTILDDSIDQSLLNLKDNLVAQSRSLSIKEQMQSIFTAESCIDFVIEKVCRIKYMQELDKKITPHTIGHTIN